MQARNTEIRWGVYFIIMQQAWMQLEKLLGYHDEKIAQQAGFTMLVMIPSLLFYYLALRAKSRRVYGGQMPFKEGLISGLFLTFVITILSPASQLITSLIVVPDYFDKMIAYSVATGKMTLEAAEAAFNLGNYVLISTLFAAGAGIATSVLMAGLLALLPAKK